jgi:hypothetical protein
VLFPFVSNSEKVIGWLFKPVLLSSIEKLNVKKPANRFIQSKSDANF